MKNDNEQILTEFHNKANSAYFTLLKGFEAAVKNVNRQTEEYKFQQVKESYIHSLKQQLEHCASIVMQDHLHNRKDEDLSQNLQHHLQQYLHQFVQKIRDY